MTTLEQDLVRAIIVELDADEEIRQRVREATLYGSATVAVVSGRWQDLQGTLRRWEIETGETRPRRPVVPVPRETYDALAADIRADMRETNGNRHERRRAAAQARRARMKTCQTAEQSVDGNDHKKDR